MEHGRPAAQRSRATELQRSCSHDSLGSSSASGAGHAQEGFPDRIGKKVAELVREYQDQLLAQHAAECSRLRNEGLEQLLLLRAEVGRLSAENKELTGRRPASPEALAPPPAPAPAAPPPLPEIVKAAGGPEEELAQGSDCKGAYRMNATDTFASFGTQEEQEDTPSLPHQVDSELDRTDTFAGSPVSLRRAGAPGDTDAALSQPSFNRLRRADRMFDISQVLEDPQDAEVGTPGGAAGPSMQRNIFSGTAVLTISDEGDPESRWMIHPNSKLRFVMDFVSICLLVWDAITVPYDLAFHPEPSVTTKTVAYFGAVFWVLDCAATFFTGYYIAGDGDLEMRLGKVAMHYVRGWLLPDLVIICSDWVSLALGDGADRNPLQLLRLNRLARVLRLGRALRAMAVYQRLRNIGHLITPVYVVGSYAVFVEITSYVVVILWVCHVFACIWYAIGESAYVHGSDTGHSWLDLYGEATLGEEKAHEYTVLNPAFLYLTCLHFAVSNTVIGWIPVDPTNSMERGFNISTLVLGFMFSGCMVSSLSSWLTQIEISKQERVQTMGTLRRFLRENGVETSLANRIDHHVKERLSMSQRLTQDEVVALRLLTPALRSDLYHDMWGPHLLGNPVFRIFDGLNARVTVAMCVGAVTSHRLEVGAELFNPDSKPDAAYVVIEGSLSYHHVLGVGEKIRRRNLLDDEMGDSSAVHEVTRGMWLGELALWVPWRYAGVATVCTTLETLSIDVAQVQTVLAKFPTLAALRREYCAAMADKLSELDQAQLTDMGASVEHGAVVMSIRKESRLLFALPAFRLLRHKYAWRSLLSDSLDNLRQELEGGSRTLVLTGTGAVERVALAAALRITRPDGKVFMILGPLHPGSSQELRPELPSITLQDAQPEEGLARLLAADLAPFADALSFGQVTHTVVTSVSKRYQALGLTNRTFFTIFGASLQKEVLVGSSVDLQERLDLNRQILCSADPSVSALDKVFAVRNPMGELVYAAWLPPSSVGDDVTAPARRWEKHKPALGPHPTGFGAAAKLRLIVMAQGNSRLLLEAFQRLPDRDRKVLGEELARTGCESQYYKYDVLRDSRGPAFLVYYAPAYLQKAGLLDPQGALSVLAELLRQARTMWPLKAALAGTWVTIRIDAFKAETVAACQDPPPGEAWVLDKTSERTASVSRVSVSDLGARTGEGDARRSSFRGASDLWANRCILHFGRAHALT